MFFSSFEMMAWSLQYGFPLIFLGYASFSFCCLFCFGCRRLLVSRSQKDGLIRDIFRVNGHYIYWILCHSLIVLGTGCGSLKYNNKKSSINSSENYSKNQISTLSSEKKDQLKRTLIGELIRINGSSTLLERHLRG